MNDIFMANLMADRPPEPAIKPIRGLRLHKNSMSKDIIEYLFEHGETHSKDIVAALKLKNVPMAYLQPHLVAARVIYKPHKLLYSMNPDMTRADFGLSDDA